MSTFAQILAPLTMLLPALTGSVAPVRDVPAPVDPLQPLDAEQVSIEQRVTIRVGPRPAPMPMTPLMFDNDPDTGPRFAERKIGKCLSIQSIAGVQPVDNGRLLLIMRDRRLVTASLRKGCQGRDFYSGFRVEKNSDGQICSGRDLLVSRGGTSCQVTGFYELVQVGG